MTIITHSTQLRFDRVRTLFKNHVSTALCPSLSRCHPLSISQPYPSPPLFFSHPLPLSPFPPLHTDSCVFSQTRSRTLFINPSNDNIPQHGNNSSKLCFG